MTRNAKTFLRRFVQDESGVLLVPFVMWSVLILGVTVSAIEFSTVSIRHYALERALDESVREVRLGTGQEISHGDLKQAICSRTSVLPGCEETLLLEMLPVSFREWTAPPATADCVDRVASVDDPRSFVAGGANQVMMLRACYKFTPISPVTWLSPALQTDDQGAFAVVSTAAFVQEPE